MVWVFFLWGVWASCCTLGCDWLLVFSIGVASVFLGWVFDGLARYAFCGLGVVCCWVK